MKRVQSSISSFFAGSKKSRSDLDTQDASHNSVEKNNPVSPTGNDTDEDAFQLQASSLPDALVGGCIDQGRFDRWRIERKWLTLNADRAVQCKCCSDIGELGPHTKERLHIDPAFVKGVKTKSAKKLHDKISKHAKCQSHVKCVEIIQKRGEMAIEKGVDNNMALWRKCNEKKLKTTEFCMRTAYMICKNDLSFKIQPQLVELQKLNGVDLGQMLHSDKACRNMLIFIADKMTGKLSDFIKKSTHKFSILIDESTTASNKTCLIIYIRIPFEDDICNFFLQLVELQACTGAAICDTVLQTLENLGLQKDMLRTRLIGFATDGAAAMMGKYRGAATLLREKINPNLTVIHCMSHKLELAVHDAVKQCTDASHFQIFIDSLYAYFSQSPKHMRELELTASNLGIQARRIGRVFDVRWLSSSCTSVTALWESYPALVKIPSSERAKCSGIHKKMTQWLFLEEMAFVKDALETLQALSLFLQRRDATAVTANTEVDVAVRALGAMRQVDGTSAKRLHGEYGASETFKGVNVSQPSDRDKRKAEVFREGFYTSLAENIQRRLDDNGIISASAALNPSNWPPDEDERILYGDEKLLAIQKKLAVDIGESNYILTAVSTLPVSTAECERGFSAMNRALTDERNRMQICTLNALLFLSINGPDITSFPAHVYAEMWIKNEGRHAANDQPTGKPKNAPQMNNQSRLFC
uniref:HAT C-terminal dimerisation domain-containing protein n=1 Tax=Neogobius melanostomus TaxID=47308 RepID=A0A8C6U3T2_9GOBI